METKSMNHCTHLKKTGERTDCSSFSRSLSFVNFKQNHIQHYTGTVKDHSWMRWLVIICDLCGFDHDWSTVLALTEHHAMKVYWRSGGIARHILDLGTKWRWVVSFNPTGQLQIILEKSGNIMDQSSSFSFQILGQVACYCLTFSSHSFNRHPIDHCHLNC